MHISQRKYIKGFLGPDSKKNPPLLSQTIDRLLQIIDVVVPYNRRVDSKDAENKLERYQNLARDFKQIWNMNADVIPLGMGPLSTPTIEFKERLGEIGIGTKIVELQKTAILYSARIHQKCLEL